MDQEVSRVLSSLALDGKSQKEKIDAIYNYLIRNVKYVSDAELADESNVIKYSSYAALVQHSAVCQGFAGPSIGCAWKAASTAGSSPVTP